MAKLGDMFPSKFLKQSDVNPPVIGTIQDIIQEVVDTDSGDTKPVIHFHERNIKPMVCNRGNAETLTAAFGDGEGPAFWSGKRIEIYADPSVMYAGKRVGGIRLRIPSAQHGNNHSPAALWDMPTCVAKCLEAGITKDDMIAAMKAAGHTGFNSTRATPFVQKLIADKSIETPFTEAPVEADIPF